MYNWRPPDWMNEFRKDCDYYQCREAGATAMLEAVAKDLMKLVDKQANDKGLWFIHVTASEAYLQQELRKLHAAIECMADLKGENEQRDLDKDNPEDWEDNSDFRPVR